MPQESVGNSAPAAPSAPPPAPEGPAHPVREVVVALLTVLLGILAAKTLPIPPTGALALLVLLGVGAILVDRRPLGRYGLSWPLREREGAQELTLASVVMGPVLALGAAQLVAWLSSQRWLAPLPNLRLELIPYFLGLHVVWAALPEELLFRAYLQTKVVAALDGPRLGAMGRPLAIVVVAAVYLGVHLFFMDARSLLGVGILGLLLGWLRERTGSIIGPLICHTAYNAALAWIQVSFA